VSFAVARARTRIDDAPGASETSAWPFVSFSVVLRLSLLASRYLTWTDLASEVATTDTAPDSEAEDVTDSAAVRFLPADGETTGAVVAEPAGAETAEVAGGVATVVAAAAGLPDSTRAPVSRIAADAGLGRTGHLPQHAAGDPVCGVPR
jgi:hypothetical protein